MDVTFISIHDLTPEAHILYSSDSVIDILGYTPEEIANRSCWEFFPQDELPYAQMFHQKRVTMDNAAVLVYCNVKSKSGEYVACECCFTIVYDVMIVCTSFYHQNDKSAGRALAAPIVRRLFTSSPKDPRYHMLSHLSSKFTQSAKFANHEPRAALFLNRFTRTLTIMYATSGVQDILGISAAEMRGRSFYFCVAENCLPDAVKCLEQAKGNDSIAYLRFWFRDPRRNDPAQDSSADSDEEMTTDDGSYNATYVHESSQSRASEPSGITASGGDTPMTDAPSRLMHDSSGSSGESTRPADTHEAIFGTSRGTGSSSASSLTRSPVQTTRDTQQDDAVEIEAVVSCASDGLVVCLRRARPMVPPPTSRPSQPMYKNGLFAAPWANEPVLPPVETRPGAGYAPAFAPSLGPMGARHSNSAASARINGPERSDFMAAIRDQAVFAWALTSINGALADYCFSKPKPGAYPPSGLPVWKNEAKCPVSPAKMNGLAAATAAAAAATGDASPLSGRHLPEAIRNGEKINSLIFGDPGLAKTAPEANQNSRK